MNHSQLQDKARSLNLLILDVDGVLTDGRLWLMDDGSELKSFHVRDGLGLRLLMDAGVEVAAVSGRKSNAVRERLAELNFSVILEGWQDKGAGLAHILTTTRHEAQYSAYMGDDLPDIPALKKVGMACAVADAAPEVRACADWISQTPGGYGAVRELCDLILHARRHEG